MGTAGLWECGDSVQPPLVLQCFRSVPMVPSPPSFFPLLMPGAGGQWCSPAAWLCWQQSWCGEGKGAKLGAVVGRKLCPWEGASGFKSTLLLLRQEGALWHHWSLQCWACQPRAPPAPAGMRLLWHRSWVLQQLWWTFGSSLMLSWLWQPSGCFKTSR